MIGEQIQKRADRFLFDTIMKPSMVSIFIVQEIHQETVLNTIFASQCHFCPGNAQNINIYVSFCLVTEIQLCYRTQLIDCSSKQLFAYIYAFEKLTYKVFIIHSE